MKKKPVEFDPIGCDTSPKWELGTIYLDALRQVWKYCEVRIHKDCPPMYKWVPFKWICTIPVEKKEA